MFAPFAVLILTARKRKKVDLGFFSGNCREEFVSTLAHCCIYRVFGVYFFGGVYLAIFSIFLSTAVPTLIPIIYCCQGEELLRCFPSPAVSTYLLLLLLVTRC